MYMFYFISGQERIKKCFLKESCIHSPALSSSITSRHPLHMIEKRSYREEKTSSRKQILIDFLQRGLKRTELSPFVRDGGVHQVVVQQYEGEREL